MAGALMASESDGDAADKTREDADHPCAPSVSCGSPILPAAEAARVRRIGKG
jgi:hypothetical protein